MTRTAEQWATPPRVPQDHFVSAQVYSDPELFAWTEALTVFLRVDWINNAFIRDNEVNQVCRCHIERGIAYGNARRRFGKSGCAQNFFTRPVLDGYFFATRDTHVDS